MSTYNITLNDNLLEGAKGSFPNQTAVKVWMEQQLERMLRQMSVDNKKQKKQMRKLNISERIKALSAVPASSSNNDYKDEIMDLMSDKY